VERWDVVSSGKDRDGVSEGTCPCRHAWYYSAGQIAEQRTYTSENAGVARHACRDRACEKTRDGRRNAREAGRSAARPGHCHGSPSADRWTAWGRERGQDCRTGGSWVLLGSSTTAARSAATEARYSEPEAYSFIIVQEIRRGRATDDLWG